MVHLVKDGEEPTDFVVDGHTNMQQSCSLAVAVSRHSYSINKKRELVQAISTLVSNGVPIRRACPLLVLPHQYYYHFKKVVQAVDELERTNFLCTTRSTVPPGSYIPVGKVFSHLSATT